MDSWKTSDARVDRDEVDVRSRYEDFVPGEPLGTATLFISQQDVEAECLRRGYYHPWYSVGSPFGGTIVPVEMSYHAVRPLFTRRFHVVGLFYKWSFEYFAPVLTGVPYEMVGRVSDKWIKNDREFVSYEADCRDSLGNVVFVTRRTHVLDFLKRSVPRTLITGARGLEHARREERHLDVPGAMSLAMMAQGATESCPPRPAPATPVEVRALASSQTKPGDPLPIAAMSYSQERFELDWRLGAHGKPPLPNRNFDSVAAAREGLPAPVAPGTWIMGLVFQTALAFFGERWASSAKADLTMRRPVFPGDFVTANGVVTDVAARGRTTCDVWVEDQRGEKKVIGIISAPTGR